MKNPKISIIIPIYNSEQYLNKCIQSIINQSYKNIEIILVDDGSVDESLNICKLYERLDNRIKLIHQENHGVSYSRNIGLNIATGELIAFVDSDDYIEYEMYEAMYQTMAAEECDIVGCNICYEKENGKQIGICNNCAETFYRTEFAKKMYDNKSFNGYVCNKLYKKSVITDDVNFDEKCKILEDNLFNYTILKCNEHLKCSYINKKLYHYIQHNNSACNGKYTLDRLQYFDVRKQECKILEELGYSNDFIKTDFVINFVKDNYKINKLGLEKSELYNMLKEDFAHYINNINLNGISLIQKIKYYIAIKVPIIFYTIINIRKENI